MELYEIDIKILNENFDIETINKINIENVSEILIYLNNNGIYYYKDLFLSLLELFLFSSKEFIRKFEYLKNKLGNDYINKLGEDNSLIEIMYEI